MNMGHGGFQECNQLPMVQEFTKYQGHVNNPRRIAEYTARCFDRAMSDIGPTQLNIPRDYFYGDIDVEIPPPQRLDRGPGGDTSLDQAAELLAGARFPVIVSGGGVVMADAVEECRAIAELLGAPVVNSYQHNDSFPASHPLWCGPLGYQGSKAGMKLISKADVVLVLGSRLGPFGTLPQHGIDYWHMQAKIIGVVSRQSNLVELVHAVERKITHTIVKVHPADVLRVFGRIHAIDPSLGEMTQELELCQRCDIKMPYTLGIESFQN